MLCKRIIPCLDVRNGLVVKGVQFKNHKVMGGITELAAKYSQMGADELVFYDISASTEDKTVDKSWVQEISKVINIPFCVAGGIKSLEDARLILNEGADKISINTPALINPMLIKQLSDEFGSQCVVVGMDIKTINSKHLVHAKTGNEATAYSSELSGRCTIPMIASGGAGCMEDFTQVFRSTNVDGALAASVFHKDVFTVQELKKHLQLNKINVRG
jgi:imidazole glycerol-phosphate synthase subunit HisF